MAPETAPGLVWESCRRGCGSQPLSPLLPLLLLLLFLAAVLIPVPCQEKSLPTSSILLGGRGTLTTLAPQGQLRRPPCLPGHPSTVSTRCLSPGSSKGAGWPSVFFLHTDGGQDHGSCPWFRRPQGERAPWVSFSHGVCPECLAHTLFICPRSCQAGPYWEQGEPQ